jgi:DNA primase large subunit
MKVLVDIVDNEAVFGMKVLKSLSFIRKAKPVSSVSAALLNDLNEAAEEVRLHKQGKIKLKTANELLNEL